jgi:hypothetical protein
VFLSDLDGLAPFLKINHFQATTCYGGYNNTPSFGESLSVSKLQDQA